MEEDLKLKKFYVPRSDEGTYSLEIEKIDKEIKKEYGSVPFIRLFCKSCGKCGV